MVIKEELRLGQKVLAGDERKEGIIEMLAQTFAFLKMEEGELMIGYENIYAG